MEMGVTQHPPPKKNKTKHLLFRDFVLFLFPFLLIWFDFIEWSSFRLPVQNDTVFDHWASGPQVSSMLESPSSNLVLGSPW